MKHLPIVKWIRPTFLAALALACFGAQAQPPAQGQNLSAEEQRLVATVKQQMPAALALLQRAVLINSGTLNPQGVREVGRLYAAELEALGFKTRWVDMPAAMQRAGHLVAERVPAAGAARGKRLLLLGHLDTVFEKDSVVVPWAADGNTVRGQGVSDMKGGNAILIEALRALHGVGALEAATVRVIFTGDEELVGQPVEQARAAMLELARSSDVALSFEALSTTAQGQDAATVGRRASGGWQLDVAARTGHSSGVFGAGGFGAIYEAARIINAFRERLIEPDLSFNVGAIVGGTSASFDDAQSQGSAFGKRNVIARDTLARGDLRYLTAEQGAKARERMQAIVEQHLTGARATIRFSETYPPMAPTPGNYRLLEQYSRASQDVGLGAVGAGLPGSRGAGDVQFVAPLLDCLDGLGATGGRAHSPDEYLELSSIEKGTLRAAVLMHRLTR